MNWTMGVCQYCGTMFHEVYVVLVWQHNKKYFANGCPVCKRAGEFKKVGDVSDDETSDGD